MLLRRFAVVKLWPELKTAEDECIARLQNTAQALGLECLEVDSFARLIHPPHTQLTQADVDFVINLHFETPKRYDIFSFVALWNPLAFYDEWGYRRFTRHLLTHDDFLSCSSRWADDHVKRCIARDATRDDPYFQLYHSLSAPILAPGIGDGKLFYAGINWERINQKTGRHGELLKILDETGSLRIYGPKIFKGVDVWEGYKSYACPVPFDGSSIIRLIHKAGICLCLSSAAHQESELMSSRLFESVAAGAVTICDENPFAQRFFGDTVLYIDTKTSPQDTASQVTHHLNWISANPSSAIELANRAQEIFRDRFTLDRCLDRIYREFPERKERLAGLRRPTKTHEPVTVFCLMPEFSSSVLERHISNCVCQTDVNIRPVLIMDCHDAEVFGNRIRTRLAELPIPFAIQPVAFLDRFPDRSLRGRRRNGEIIADALELLAPEDSFCIVSPAEVLFSDHVSSLLNSLQTSSAAGVAIANMLLRHGNDGHEHSDLAEDINLHTNGKAPLGFGRFLFHRSAVAPRIDTALRYLDALPMHLLVGTAQGVLSGRCTIVLDIQDHFTVRKLTSRLVSREREILIDFAPEQFGLQTSKGGGGSPDHLQPLSLSLKDMESGQRTALAVELAHSIPIPAFLSKLAFGSYRRWFHGNKRKQ
jgi:hypothetical protein